MNNHAVLGIVYFIYTYHRLYTHFMGKLEVFNHLHGYFQTNPEATKTHMHHGAGMCWYIVYLLHIGHVYHCWINGVVNIPNIGIAFGITRESRHVIIGMYLRTNSDFTVGSTSTVTNTIIVGRSGWYEQHGNSWFVYSTIKIKNEYTIIYEALKTKLLGPKEKTWKKGSYSTEHCHDAKSLNICFFYCPYLFGAAYPSLFRNQLNGSEAIIANQTTPKFIINGWYT